MLKVFRGNTMRLILKATDKDTGDSIDLTDYDVLFTVEPTTNQTPESPDDGNAIIKKTFTINQPTVSPQGYIELSVDDTDHQPGKYLFDVKLVSDTEQVNSSNGIFKIEQPITTRDSDGS